MAKINEIAISQADEVIKINKQKVTIYTSITTNDFATAVRTIADSCFVPQTIKGEDGKEIQTGVIDYRPEFKEVAKRYVVLKYFTDIDLGETAVDEIFELSQADWYLDLETAVANHGTYLEVQKAADELIEYRIRTRQTKFDDLCDVLKQFADKATDMKSLEEIADKLKNLDDKAVVEAIVNK